MVEIHGNGAAGGYWGYLINDDKSAAVKLEQLCIGLAKVICTLEPGPADRLTPRRLAAFYKSVGGNLDALFLRGSESGLSFLYRTIGCFHSLEPSENPFKTPSMPCLTPEGFVKWQTVQLLLCPEEHVGFLQEAVRKYNVPRPDGGDFPKAIPRESFPDRPDADMEAWHKQVTSQLNEENYMHRLKFSPHHSPHPHENMEEYFGQPLPRIQRPSRPSRRQSQENHIRQFNPRRRSEPDFTSPAYSADHARDQFLDPHDIRTRSTSGNRPGLGSRQRSATTGHALRLGPNGSNLRYTNERPPSSFPRNQHGDRIGRSPTGRSPDLSSHGESSADDASSEDSHNQRRSFRSKAASSLLSVLPFTTPWQRRSRSHDTSARQPRPSSRRGDRAASPPPRANTETLHRPSPAVRFRQDVFDHAAAASAPESQVRDKRPHSAHRSESGHRHDSRHRSEPSYAPEPRPDRRYARNPGLTDPVSPIGYKMSRDASSGSGSENRPTYELPLRQAKKTGTSQRRVSLTGVQGRKYAHVEPSIADPVFSAADRSTANQQDPRIRYSLAV